MTILAQLDPATLERLGTAGIVAVLMAAGITWLIRDRWRVVADRDRERQRSHELGERLVEQAERVVPVIERNAAALERATRCIERLERDR